MSESEKLDQVFSKADDVTHRQERNAKRVAFVLFLAFAVLVALSILVQRNNENIEDLRVVAEDTQISVNHLEDFVDALEAEQASPGDQAQDEAISRAVQLVPEIKQILCEQFPTATACQEG